MKGNIVEIVVLTVFFSEALLYYMELMSFFPFVEATVKCLPLAQHTLFGQAGFSFSGSNHTKN